MDPKHAVALPVGVRSIISATLHALIGGHAVNAWGEPRATTDFDLTIAADLSSLQRIEMQLAGQGDGRARRAGALRP
jgi:hypothetical protein